MSKKFDVIVIGGGPAGLTAGIYLSRAKQRVLIVDEGSIGGQMIMSYMIANYPGVLETTGYKLAGIMKKQAREFGCEIISNSEVTKIDITGTEKVIEVDGEDSYTAPAVIIAAGGRPRTIGIEAEERFKGHGISYCATCDGDFFTDQEIMVIGGGNTALEEAVALTQYASKITLVHQFDNFQAYPHAVEEARKNSKIEFIMESEAVDFIGTEGIEGVKIKNLKTGTLSTIPVTGVFIFIGYIPNTGRFKGMVDLNDRGEIICNEDMTTNLPGVFAAGDIREKRYRQITTAVSDGTVAALSALEYLKG